MTNIHGLNMLIAMILFQSMLMLICLKPYILVISWLFMVLLVMILNKKQIWDLQFLLKPLDLLKHIQFKLGLIVLFIKEISKYFYTRKILKLKYMIQHVPNYIVNVTLKEIQFQFVIELQVWLNQDGQNLLNHSKFPLISQLSFTILKI